jgi:DNA polymerase III delta subunit
MNHFDVPRQQIFNAVLKDRVRMSATDLHQLQRSGGQALDLIGQLQRQVTLPVFVYEFHFEIPQQLTTD